MRLRMPFACLAVLSLCLAAAIAVPVHSASEGPAPQPLSEGCYELASWKADEENSSISAFEHLRGFGFSYRPGQRESSEEEPEPAAQPEPADPEPELMVTVLETEDDGSGTVLRFRLDRPTGSDGDLLADPHLQARRPVAGC